VIAVNSLQALIRSVATALKDQTAEGIDLSYGLCNGTWLWTCSVAARKTSHGRGYRVTRPRLWTTGETPEAAVAELLRKIAIPGWVDA
jgi:hypothetical protein